MYLCCDIIVDVEKMYNHRFEISVTTKKKTVVNACSITHLCLSRPTRLVKVSPHVSHVKGRKPKCVTFS